jgi:hypothetical protein
MTEAHITILLLIIVAAFVWVIVRVIRTPRASAESSARADTFSGGAGLGAEQMDSLAEKRDPKIGE